ncbi:unnamed protein product, partial [Effrenium voratum]
EPDPDAIWKQVLDQEDARLPGCVSLERALDAARSGDWGLCAYLSARLFKDLGGDAQAAQRLGDLDERCHRYLWLAVACPSVVDIPPGQERLRLRLEDGGEPRWIPTDLLESEIFPNGTVVVRSGKSQVLGQLVEKEFQCLQCSLMNPPAAQRCGHCGHSREEQRSRWAEHFNPGEQLELSQLQWQKRLRPRNAKEKLQPRFLEPGSQGLSAASQVPVAPGGAATAATAAFGGEPPEPAS